MKARLCSLLCMLVEWATTRNAPVELHAWQGAVAILATPPTQLHFFTVGHAIVRFFNGLRAPVLVLFGELQLQHLGCWTLQLSLTDTLAAAAHLLANVRACSTCVSHGHPAASHPVQHCADEFHNLLLPETVRGDARMDASSHVRDVLVKQLLIEGPCSVAWSITGSAMVMVWMEIAQLPPYSLRSGNTPINLPVRWLVCATVQTHVFPEQQALTQCSVRA